MYCLSKFVKLTKQIYLIFFHVNYLDDDVRQTEVGPEPAEVWRELVPDVPSVGGQLVAVVRFREGQVRECAGTAPVGVASQFCDLKSVP